jgi:hypothetical protein
MVPSHDIGHNNNTLSIPCRVVYTAKGLYCPAKYFADFPTQAVAAGNMAVLCDRAGAHWELSVS